MGTISSNFSYKEFEESDTAKAKGFLNTITTFEVRDSVKALTLKVLQPLRNKWGKSMHINSGYRCKELNAYVGGVATSQHCKGEAADISTGSESQSFELASLAYKNKSIWNEIDQMILYPTFVHFSHRRVGTQRHQLLYNYRYKGKKI